MKRLLTITAATVVALGTGAVEARANHAGARGIVEGWYHRFLGRCVDEAGACYWVPQLNRKPAEVALAQLVASQEYYHRNGCCPDGFVRGLFRDVLGRADVCHQDVRYWVSKLSHCGCREKLAREFLCAARVDVLALGTPPPPVMAPAPVVVAPPPPVYQAPAPTLPPAPVAFARPPAPVYAPPPVQGPDFRLRLRYFRN